MMHTLNISKPMTNQELHERFSQGLNWNALSYILYKSATTILIFLLYRNLETHMFSMYGNINSITFLMLLWLDFGFQKAIPRFVLEYAKNQQSLNAFLKRIFLFKITMLLLCIPIYAIAISRIAHLLQIRSYAYLLCAGVILLITEGIISIVRLVYHSFFLHKTFSTINTATLLIELIISIVCIYHIKDGYTLLIALIISKIIASYILLLAAGYHMPLVYNQIIDQPDIKITDLNQQFFLHAIMMYMSTNIKSLTERNFLFPIFTITFGPHITNMFKVANDAALLFYRIVLKTIGTTDTSLFSYALSINQKDETWQVAFPTLITKISSLVIPLLGIIYITYTNEFFIPYDPVIFQFFIIITIGLLLEMLFSPYERVLEVKKHYYLLICAYAPYITMVTIFFVTNTMTYIGMLHSVLIIHIVRLVSTLIMVILTSVYYPCKYPFRFTFLLSGGVLIVTHMIVYVIQPMFFYLLRRLVV